MRKIIYYSLMLAFLTALPVYAADNAAPFGLKGGENKGPIEIDADTLDVHQDKQVAVFSGSVVAKQGNMTLKSDRMTVYYRDKAAVGEQKIQKIDVDGNVFITTPAESAKGSKGVYYVDQKIIRLFNNVTLTQGKNILNGDALEYDMTTGRSRVVSQAAASQIPGGAVQSGGGRVKAVFTPDDAK